MLFASGCRDRSLTSSSIRLILLATVALQTLTLTSAVSRRTRVNSRDICQRDPPDIQTEGLSGDRGFRIQIIGHAQRYAPGQVYTVALNGSYPNQRLSGFMLVAVPQHAQDETTTMGTFQHIETTSTRFIANCPHVVSEVNRNPKPFVEVLWTAPSSGAGCVEFRATVIERGNNWFKDEGALTRVFCEDTRTTEGERSAEMVPDCCACGTAKYQLTFHGKWSQTSHPKDYPTQRRLLHWSNIVGASHSRNYFVWQYGAYASRGVKEVCELGYPRTTEDEIRQKSHEVRSIIKTTGIWWSEPHGIDQNRTARFTTDRRRHLMTMLTMLGPSPDWCVGVSGVDLCLPNCTWAGDMDFDLYPWDAGTDDGISYMSPNAKSDPQQKIHRITNSLDDPRSPFHGRDPIHPLATLQIRRLNAPSPTSAAGGGGIDGQVRGGGVDALRCEDNSDTEDVLEVTDAAGSGLSDMEKQKLMMMLQDGGKCAVAPWDDWSGCSVTCGVGVRVRKRMYVNPMVNEEMCGLPLMESENCIGLENECESVDEDCAMTAWSSWSPCSASCEKGIRQRRRYYLNDADISRCRRESDETEMCIAEIMDCDLARARLQSAGVCALPVSIGPCRGNFSRWYYDNSNDRCVEFGYGGCRGNGNRFESIEDCHRACSKNGELRASALATPTSTTLANKELNSGACGLPQDSGPCRANIRRWYFDTAMGKCLPFGYGGCGGNGNQFLTEDACIEACVLRQEQHSEATTTGAYRAPTTHTIQRSQTSTNGLVDAARRVTSPTPVHCVVGAWSSWSSCSTTCSDASANGAWRSRKRLIRRPSANGGRPCSAQLEQRKACNDLPQCASDSRSSGCVMSSWSTWSQCSKSCGNDAIQERRSRLVPAADVTATATTPRTDVRSSSVTCSGPIRFLRRICSDLPPCSRSASEARSVWRRVHRLA